MTTNRGIINGVGIGLRHRHFQEIIENKPDIPWFEVHTENFFSSGSPASIYLEKIREDYPISAHCVAMSPGSAGSLDIKHLKKVKDFIERYDPFLVSDHLSWSNAGNIHLPDLLPLAYTEESLNKVVSNVMQIQDFLGRQILIENPSSYLSFVESEIPEAEFFVEIAKKSGCGLLVDINNIYVSCHNHKLNIDDYLAVVPTELVQEIHLAGYSVHKFEGKDIYIDTHGTNVYPAVWELYKKAMAKFGNIPTLIEWDTDVPEISVLIEEKKKAEDIMNSLSSMS